MTKLRAALAVLVLATGCATQSSSTTATSSQGPAASKDACLCKADACLCAHCGTGRGTCACKK